VENGEENRGKKIACRIGCALALALAATLCRAQGLYLAPGQTLVILDAADPSVRVLLQAPPQAPLDLAAVLVTGPGDSVHSIVTRIQMKAAAGMARQADGSVALSEAAPTPLGGATVLQGGALVFANGRFVYHPGAAPAASSQGAPPPRAAMGGRLLISRPGADKARAERDIAQCRRHAEASAAQFLRSADKVEAYNGSMYGCLKGLGYQIHAPAA
jgi:hypothetical protein